MFKIDAQRILFDLDGTLTDPKEGVTKSIVFALEHFGMKTTPDEFVWCIGPPLHESFSRILGDSERAKLAVDHYRERYRAIGMYENKLYPGVHEALAELKRSDRTLYVATSKLGPIAEQVIEHFGLKPYFTKIYGSELDGTRGDKGELIAYLLEREGIDPSGCVMVGDRKHDVIGAAKNGVPCIGVSWGYGSWCELVAAGASGVVDRWDELVPEIGIGPSQEDPEIRPLSLSAMTEIAPLLSESVAEGFSMLRRLTDEFRSGANLFNRAGETLLGAYFRGALVGVGGRNIDPYAGDPNTCRIRHLYVLDRFRRRGVGKALMEGLVRGSRERFERVTLRTDDGPARKFYESLGFEFLGEGTTTHAWRGSIHG